MRPAAPVPRKRSRKRDLHEIEDSPKRVLVIGGTLFIGKLLVQELLRQHHEVYILHRKPRHGFGKRVHNLVADRNYDLIVCAGDDTTDESMFRLSLKNLITIKVGDRETTAQYRLPSPAAFRRFLEQALSD